MRSPIIHHRVKGDRFIIAASPRLLDGELTRTSILRSTSKSIPMSLLGGLFTLILALWVLWAEPALNLSCARPAENEPVSCTLTTTGLSGHHHTLLEDVRAMTRTPSKYPDEPGAKCHISTGPDLEQAYRWDGCTMNPAPFNLMIADPNSLETLTHEEPYRSSWLFAACCLIITAACAWLALWRQEDLRWEIAPERGRIKVFRGGLRGVSSTVHSAADLSDLKIEKHAGGHHLTIPDLPITMDLGHARANQVIEAYTEFRDSLRGSP